MYYALKLEHTYTMWLMNIVVVMQMAMIMGWRNTDTRAMGCGYMVGEDGICDEGICRRMDDGEI